MLATNPSAQGLVGLNRERLSHMDKRMANIQYKCMGEKDQYSVLGEKPPEH